MTDRTPTTLFDCTCLPLNRRLSVHEQGCVERAVSEARAAALLEVRAAIVEAMLVENQNRGAVKERQRILRWLDGEPSTADQLRAALEEPTPMGYVPASGDDSEPFR